MNREMNNNQTREQQALHALEFIIPLLKDFTWIISGGFAAYLHGVERSITDIDIDVLGSVHDANFQQLLQAVADYITSPLEHWVDQNYDNYNVELTVDGIIVDLCASKELKIINKQSGQYELLYKHMPFQAETVQFHGLELPIFTKQMIIANKEMLVWQRASDHKDIEGLKALL